MTTESVPIRVEKISLHAPTLDELAKVLEKSLAASFANSKVSVVDCPDLSVEPFHLAAEGICGKERVADIGGVSYMMPMPEMDKVYDLVSISEWTQMKSEALFIGAGATTNQVDDRLSEMIPNVKLDKHNTMHYKSKICRIDHKNGVYKLEDNNTSCIFRQLGNLYISEGQTGKVIEVCVSNRKGSLDFIKLLQSALKNEYNERPVALGGTFLMAKGKANIHIMPGYSTTPLTCKEHVDNWLHFFDMSSPLVVTGYLVSHDPGYKLRMEHFHCASNHGDGGHFHYDTTPEEVEYIGYFNVPKYLYRIDRWSDDHYTVDYAD